MTDLNAKAAECMGLDYIVNDVGQVYILTREYDDGSKLYTTKYSPKTNIAQAWMLAEKLQKTGSYVAIETHDYIPQTDEMIDCWRVCVNGLFFHYAPTAAEAITAACVEALSKCPK